MYVYMAISRVPPAPQTKTISMKDVDRAMLKTHHGSYFRNRSPVTTLYKKGTHQPNQIKKKNNHYSSKRTPETHNTNTAMTQQQEHAALQHKCTMSDCNGRRVSDRKSLPGCDKKVQCRTATDRGVEPQETACRDALDCNGQEVSLQRTGSRTATDRKLDCHGQEVGLQRTESRTATDRKSDCNGQKVGLQQP